MNVEEIIRKLAKSNRYQTLFVLTKESGLPIFENIINHTEYQILFLNYLNFYYSLYTEVAMNDIPMYIFKDEIYEDAYMFYKRKEKVKDMSGTIPQRPDTIDDKDFSWVMKRKPKSR